MITITNEDNMALMSRYPDKYFDLAIVDPPYGINVNVSIGRRKGDKKSDYHKFAGNDNSIPSADYFDELFRISKNQIIWGGNYMTDFLTPTPCWVLWDKGFSEDVTFAQFEMAWTSFNSSCKKYDFNAAANRNRIHPTQKPVALYKWLLDKYAKENDKILDTHLGSGSIVIACHDYGFDLTACELDKEYYDKAMLRLTNHQSQTKLF
jgi:site-specific DNA-methyltransferase (adenine-specific)